MRQLQHPWLIATQCDGHMPAAAATAAASSLVHVCACWSCDKLQLRRRRGQDSPRQQLQLPRCGCSSGWGVRAHLGWPWQQLL
jgi:hypothetical protein